MELKLITSNRSRETEILLIVPYGIETTVNMYKDNKDNLLIVPYGIETS